MKIERDSLPAIEFGGLEIRDYTAGRDLRSSMAEVTVPAGVGHPRAWSRRSDKLYCVLEGDVHFVVGEQVLELVTSDVCVVPQGTRFSYENRTDASARMLLVHTPPFDLCDEVMEEE